MRCILDCYILLGRAIGIARCTLKNGNQFFSSLTDSSRARQQGAQEVYMYKKIRQIDFVFLTFFFSIGIVVYVSWEVARKPRGQTKHIFLSLSRFFFNCVFFSILA